MSARLSFLRRHRRLSLEAWAAIAAVVFIAGLCVATLPRKPAIAVSAVAAASQR